MELAEAAAVLGTVETVRTYFGQDVSTVASAIQGLKNLGNITREFSPLTMNNSWSWIWRLFFLILFTGTGTIVNAFFVATFFISHEMKKKGNVFLACLGFADLIITLLVVPSVIVVMLSQVNETTQVCHALQLLTQWSTYAYSVFFMLVAIDIYTRLVRGYIKYRKCITYPLSAVAVLNLVISLATAGAGVYYGLDYDYCNREHYGNYWFRFITTMTFYVIPCVITIYLLLNTSCVMQDRVVRLIRYKRYPQFEKDKDLTNLHLSCYMLFVAAWIPYLVLVNLYPDATDAKYYALIWIGLVRSAITSLFYSAMNEHFRQSFLDLFVYCCCKGYSIRRRKCFDHKSKMVKALVLQNMRPGAVSAPAVVPRREPPIQYVL